MSDANEAAILDSEYSLMEKLRLCNDIPICTEAAACIERLESDLSDALTDLNTAQQDNASCTVHIHNQAARIAQLEAQVADFIEQANTKCACAHDRPEDVCLAHSPIVAKQAARIKKLEAALRWYASDEDAGAAERAVAALKEERT